MAKKETSPELTEEFKKTLAMTKILDVEVDDELKRSFIAYAMAVNKSRAIPDVRDGLKPVHRRILYAMHEMGLYNDKDYRKCARVVGDVLGKFHPHGDRSVYDALVRLAQDFSINFPLVDGHGNFGSVDGDGAAAMRYTEARLSKLAAEMLRDLDKETVDFFPNFDGNEMEPAVLPARFPNLLVNGSDGIAVGMATNIPPHNLAEAIDGTVALIDNPEITVDELMQYIPAPDFPTGGIIMGRSGIRKAYRTGQGSIIIRSKCEIEEVGSGANVRSRIVVTEIPYQVNKAQLVKTIADMVRHHCKIGPAPTPVTYFTASPYNCTIPQIDRALLTMKHRAEYADIQEVLSYNHVRYLFSSSIISAKYAKSMADFSEESAEIQ